MVKDANDGGKRVAKKRTRKPQHRQAWEKLPDYPLWPEIERRLLAGQSSLSLAKWWKSQGHMRHLHPKTLAKYISKYKETDEIEHDQLHDMPAPVQHISALAQKYATQINLFEGYAALINLQWHRLQYIVDIEDRTKFVVEQGNKIVLTLRELHKDVADIMFRSGRLPQVPQEIIVTQGKSGNDNGKETISRKEAQSSRKVAEAGLRFHSMIQKYGQEQIKTLSAPEEYIEPEERNG